MIVRTRQFWQVALFLSKFGEEADGNIRPPAELETPKWNLAYRMFYESIGSGRTINAFELSLRNARDAFDSHLPGTKRVGWQDETGKPERLIAIAKQVFDKYGNEKRQDFWNEIAHLADKNAASYTAEVNDLAAIQSMEADGNRQSLTEGGSRVVISVHYERNIRLRNMAFKIHGYDCGICGFNFGKTYGAWGIGFAEVHHLEPVSLNGHEKKEVNPATDLIVLCANCHRMTHRKKGITLTVEELKGKIKAAAENKDTQAPLAQAL